MKMPENQYNNNNKVLNKLSRLFIIEITSTRISRWLREMDGENAEEDWKIHPHHSKLGSRNSNPSVKKVFKSF